MLKGKLTHRVRHVAVGLVLLGHESQVKNEPAKHTRPELHPRLDVDLARKRKSDARVQLAANEPIVDDVSTVTTLGEFAQFLVTSLDLEGAHIDIDGKQERDEQVGRDQTHVVLVDERPDGEVGTLGKSASSADGQDGRGGAEGVEPVLQPAAVLEFNALDLLRRQNGVQDQAQRIPGQRSQHAIDRDKATPSRPSHLLCQNRCRMLPRGLRGQCRWREQLARAQERRRRASRNVVAEEGQRVHGDRATDGDEGGTDPGRLVSATMRRVKWTRAMHLRTTELEAMRLLCGDNLCRLFRSHCCDSRLRGVLRAYEGQTGATLCFKLALAFTFWGALTSSKSYD